jgi:NAD(P)H-hydrate epimerase
MNVPVLSRDAARRIDLRAAQDYGMPTLLLMENAGRGLADFICTLDPSGEVLICCYRGNNGGDGFVLARHLDLRGRRVRVLLWARTEELEGDAATNFAILLNAKVPIEVLGPEHQPARLAAALERATVVVDALLGTGVRGEPRAPLDAVIDQLNASGRPIVAVDIPSGLDCDSGKAAAHTIRARHTCTFVAVKKGFISPGANEFIGEVHVLDIGAPGKLIEEEFAAQTWIGSERDVPNL